MAKQKNYSKLFRGMKADILQRIDSGTGQRPLAKLLANEIREYQGIELSERTARKWIGVFLKERDEESPVSNENITPHNDYDTEGKFIMSAWDDNHKVMDLETYCEYYGLPFESITSHKLVSHTGTPFYNIVWKEKSIFDDFDYIGELEKQLKKVKKNKNKKGPVKLSKVGCINLTDLHLGAYMLATKNTPQFNVAILTGYLNEAAETVNRYGYKTVHVHLLGDLIESFTGLNHKNSWKGIEQGMYGVRVVKMFVDIFINEFLSLINNLGSVKIVAGNHDRVTSSNDEDTEGGVADLVAWGLNMKGYDTEFSPTVIKHVVGSICYILNHAHLGLTKKTTQEICWMYGEKGLFNFIMEGHLHSRIQKMSSNQRKLFKMVTDDNNDCRRQTLPSMFTGNGYSDQGGWTTTPGFTITEESLSGKVNVFDYSL